MNDPKYLALPDGMDGVKFYAITGHTHRLGTSVQVNSATDAHTTGDLLYQPTNFDWEAPETKTLTPMATIPQGGGFMRRWCTARLEGPLARSATVWAG